MEKHEKPLMLIFPFDLLSHYLRCLELAKVLKKHFRIMFATSSNYSHFIDQEGFNTFSCLSIDPEEVMECARKFDFSWLNQKKLEPVFLEQVEKIKELKPIAVIGDTSPTLKMAAEKNGVKYISLMNSYISKYYALVRQVSRRHPSFRYSRKIPQKIFNLITIWAEAFAFRSVHAPFSKIRKKYGLQEMNQYLDELEGDFNLLCDLEELFPVKTLPENYQIISPLFYASTVDDEEIISRLNKNRKTIFVSMGSSGDWKGISFLNNRFFEKFNIVTAGDQRRVLNADHIINVPFVNIKKLFSLTDLVICHGGNGTIYQAFSYGIPVLCKTIHFEQEWNAHAVTRSGLGKSLDDIENFDEVTGLIDLWVERKGKKEFLAVKNQIERSKEEFEENILLFLGKHFQRM